MLLAISAVVSEVIIIISPVFTLATRDLSEFNEISGLHEVTLQLVLVMDSEFQVLHSSFSPLLVPIQLHSPPAAVYPAAPHGASSPLPCSPLLPLLLALCPLSSGCCRGGAGVRKHSRFSLGGTVGGVSLNPGNEMTTFNVSSFLTDPEFTIWTPRAR